jgi:hypothetical protein
MGIVINLRHERFAQALAQGKAANEAYVLAEAARAGKLNFQGRMPYGLFVPEVP